MNLSIDDTRALASSGWILVRAAIGTKELDAMHAAWDRWLDSVPPGDSPDGNNFGPRDLAHDAAFAICLLHTRVRAAITHLVGADAQLRSFAGRAPPAGLGLQGLHTDWNAPVDPERALIANAFWILDDMTHENGATRVVPGSHRFGRLPRGSIAQPLGHHPDEIVIEARAGDVVVTSAHLWHGGTRNVSGRRRRVAIAQFARAGVPQSGRA